MEVLLAHGADPKVKDGRNEDVTGEFIVKGKSALRSTLLLLKHGFPFDDLSNSFVSDILKCGLEKHMFDLVEQLVKVTSPLSFIPSHKLVGFLGI